jgi:hypothetical protein
MALTDMVRRRRKPIVAPAGQGPLDQLKAQQPQRPLKTPLGQDVPPVRTGTEPEDITGPDITLPTDPTIKPPPDTGVTPDTEPDKDIDILGGLGGDLGQKIQDYIDNLLSGGGAGAFDAATNEALARQIQQMRGRAGSQLAGLIGQGAAEKGMQATETDILGALAQGQLQQAVTAEQLKGQGAQMGLDLAKTQAQLGMQQQQIDLQKSQVDYQKKIDAMNNLLSMGGADNIGEYATMFKDMFGIDIDPQRFLDKESQQDFSDGMSRISQYIASGMNWEDAIDAMRKDGTIDMMGMDESDIQALYEKMQLNTNPVYQMMNALPDDMLAKWFPDMTPDEARTMIGKLALFGGMTMNADGTFSIDQDIFDKIFGGDDDPDVGPDTGTIEGAQELEDAYNDFLGGLPSKYDVGGMTQDIWGDLGKLTGDDYAKWFDNSGGNEYLQMKNSLNVVTDEAADEMEAFFRRDGAYSGTEYQSLSEGQVIQIQESILAKHGIDKAELKKTYAAMDALGKKAGFPNMQIWQGDDKYFDEGKFLSYLTDSGWTEKSAKDAIRSIMKLQGHGVKTEKVSLGYGKIMDFILGG